jgi:hypothetical protein
MTFQVDAMEFLFLAVFIRKENNYFKHSSIHPHFTTMNSQVTNLLINIAPTVKISTTVQSLKKFLSFRDLTKRETKGLNEERKENI